MACATQNCDLHRGFHRRFNRGIHGGLQSVTGIAVLAVAPEPAARWNDNSMPTSPIRERDQAKTAPMSIILSITTDRKNGGIATALGSYSAALTQRGHEHIVILPSGAAAVDGLAGMAGVSLVTMPAAMIRSHLLTGAVFHGRLRAAIGAADLIFVHNANLAPLARRSAKPVCLISHSGKLRHLAAADHAVFLSRAAQTRARDMLGPQHESHPQIHIIPHGFPVYETAAGQASSGGPVRVISAGRFVPKKGFEVLLRAANLLQQRGSAIAFDIYGDGPLRPVLADMIGRLGLEHVTLHEWRPSLDEAFAKADLFCLPSLEEPFGLVIGEGMGRGLPMVATRTDGPLDMIGQNGSDREKTLASGGILTTPGDATGLADGLEFLAGDRDRLAAASQAARRRITSDFGMDALADRLDALIATARQPRQAGPS